MIDLRDETRDLSVVRRSNHRQPSAVEPAARGLCRAWPAAPARCSPAAGWPTLHSVPVVVARGLGAHEFAPTSSASASPGSWPRSRRSARAWAVVLRGLYRSRDDLGRLRGTVLLGTRVTAAGERLGGHVPGGTCGSRDTPRPGFTLMLRLLSLSTPVRPDRAAAGGAGHTRVLSTSWCAGGIASLRCSVPSPPWPSGAGRPPWPP